MKDGAKQMDNEADGVKQLSDAYWNKNLETDYTQRSESRNFGLQVGNITFYIDPVEMSKKSLYFKVLTTSKHFVEGNRGSGRMHDGQDEIACLLQSISPTVYGICPRTIRVQSIPVLARLADKYNLKSLQFSCEYFALKADFRKCGNNILVKLLQTAIMYNYDPRLQENLIKELKARSRFLCESVDSKITKDICNIIVKYSLKHKGKGMFWGVCHRCGQQKAVDSETTDVYGLWECERCGAVYCLECRCTPCWSKLSEHLRSAFEQYRIQELRKEFEQQNTQMVQQNTPTGPFVELSEQKEETVAQISLPKKHPFQILQFVALLNPNN